jgi:hypothetical protein
MSSVCLKHQNREAVGRCKLCLKPVCEECKVISTIGMFCSAECRDKSELQEANIVRTTTDDKMGKNTNVLRGWINFFLTIVFLAVAIFLIWKFALPLTIKHQIMFFVFKLLKILKIKL